MELILEQMKNIAGRWMPRSVAGANDAHQAQAAWGRAWVGLKEGSGEASAVDEGKNRADGMFDRGLLGWLRRALNRVGDRSLSQRPLALIERINVGPRQAVTLVEADGFRVLVATSAEGSPAFYALPVLAVNAAAAESVSAGVRGVRSAISPHPRIARRVPGRVSW